MTKLVTMQGRPKLGHSFNLLSLAGPADIIKIDPRNLSDTEAGVLGLYWATRIYPDLTFGDIVAASQGQTMGKKWWEKVGSMVGNGLSDAGDKIGQWSGSTIRLVSDEKVQSAVKNYSGGSLATGGAGGLAAFLGKFGIGKKQSKEVLDAVGKDVKASANEIDAAAVPQLIQGVPNWTIGAGIMGVFGLYFLLK